MKEVAEKLFISPCMATCLTIVAEEQRKYAALRENNKKLGSLPISRTHRQMERESQNQFLNVFTDDQKETPSDMLKVFQLKNFCLQIDSIEKDSEG